MSTFLEVLAAHSILRKWLLDPAAPRRSYENITWLVEHPEADSPLSAEEIEHYKAELRRLAPSAYGELFPGDTTSEKA
jgi:hypothetical protein